MAGVTAQRVETLHASARQAHDAAREFEIEQTVPTSTATSRSQRAASSSASNGSKPSAVNERVFVGLRPDRDTAPAGRSAGRAAFVEHVVDRVDELRALPDQLVAALRERRMDRAGQREDVAAGFGREPRGDQRPGSCGRLHHDDAARQARDDAIAARELMRTGGRAERQLGDESPRPPRCGARGCGATRDRRCRLRSRSRRSVDAAAGPAASAPSCAAASMPSASPLDDRVALDRRAPRRNDVRRRGPVAVALRLPTIASNESREQFDAALDVEQWRWDRPSRAARPDSGRRRA